jgi:sec-independent protein translocase protein TatB
VFGINLPELVIIGLLFLMLFGPNQLPRMAREIGRFVNEAQRAVEEFKSELISQEDQRSPGEIRKPPRRPRKTEKKTKKKNERKQAPTGTSDGPDEF